MSEKKNKNNINNMKNLKTIIIFLVVFFVLGGLFLYLDRDLRSVKGELASLKQKMQEAQKDEIDTHGCIINKGYTWCDLTAKCFKSSEEKCELSIEEAVRSLLVEKYKKDPNEVIVAVSQNDDTHAVGAVGIGTGDQIEGGMFIAIKQDGAWELVYDGNGAADCPALEKIGFPSNMITNFCD